MNPEDDEIVMQLLPWMDIEQLREVAAAMVECASSKNYLMAVVNSGRKQDCVWKIEYPERDGASALDRAFTPESSASSGSASPPPDSPKPERKLNRTREGKIEKPTTSSRSKRRSKSRSVETFAEVIASPDSSLRASTPSPQSSLLLDRDVVEENCDVIVITASPPSEASASETPWGSHLWACDSWSASRSSNWPLGGGQHTIPFATLMYSAAVPNGLPEPRTEQVQYRTPFMAPKLESVVQNDLTDPQPGGSQRLISQV